MASMQKRTWTSASGEEKVAWRVVYADQSGRTRTRQFKKQSDAKAFRNTVTSAVATGTHVHDRDTITVAAAGDIWLKATLAGRDGRAPVEERTYDTYRDVFENHIRPRLGGVKLTKLSRAAIAAYRDQMLEDGVSRFRTKRALSYLGALLGEAQSRELVAVNNARDVRVVTRTRDMDEEDERVSVPSIEQVRDLVDRARLWSKAPPAIVIRGRITANPRFKVERGRMLYMLIRTAIATGMRISELLGLPRSKVDLNAGTITVSQRLSQKGRLGKPKSRAGYRTIEIPAELVRELREWILQRPKGDLDLVFPNASGGAEGYGNFRRRFWIPLLRSIGAARVVPGDNDDDVGIDADFTLHSLRHFHASQYISSGATPLDVMTRMGHSSIQVTFDVYGHLFQDEQAKARRRGHVESMEQLLFGRTDKP
ncbi:tyrosine-type recombinase/integrase [Bosea sp. TWI1241]|uniref:tyrosine-type recombinase/integrase n=1 Tax=Bosea sp. TWI1241 TaxID=3148904 RepID=UPI0032085AFE